MFWGLIMEPNKRYTQTVERPFHVSMATLDISTADNTAVQVMLCFENRNYLLCNLNKDQTSQVPLDLNFQEGTKIAFTSNGRGHVHLTGYLIPEDDGLDMDDLEDEDEMEEEEEEEEVPQLVGKSTKRKAESLLDAKTLKKLKTLGKMVSEEGEDSSDDDDDEEDDDEAQLGEDSDDDLEEEEEDDDEEEDEDDDEEDEEEEEEEKEPVEQKPKGKQNQKQQKNNKQEAKAAVNGKDGNQQKKNKKEQQPQQQNKKEAQNKKEQQQQPEKQQNKKDKQNEQQQVQKKRVLSGGVQIEELTVGNGQPAKNGKFVSVYYVGKLKNGKKFDATQNGEGFKFRLGAGEVIKGWDIGVAGMKVGGKRRITVPAAMGYGQKGSPPVIPPNSLLIFDVELKKVN